MVMKLSDTRKEGKPDCHLGSAKRLVKHYGELIAIPRHLDATGYKSTVAYGHSPVMSSETTNTAFQKQIIFVARSKALTPYHPNAPRNRPKETLTNVVGTRHKLHPCIRSEKYRGSSVIKLRDGDIDSLKPWKTTNQVFSECTEVKDTVGLANSGISSDIARHVHKKQGVYAD